jgi:uncharacterized delta-60 repeat protein
MSKLMNRVSQLCGRRSGQGGAVSASRRRSRPGIESLEGRQLLTAGYFDPSFGVSGKALVAFGSGGLGGTQAEAVAVQSDGKLVVAGEIKGNGDIGVTRLNPNGTLDTSFGVGGRSYVTLGSAGSTSDWVAAVAVDKQGRIVLAGTGTLANGSREIVTARLASSGSFDPTYGAGGRSYADFSVFGAVACQARGMVIDSLGRIIVAGSVQYADGHYDFGVIRLSANGYFDNTFGIHGRSDASFITGGPSSDVPAAVTLDASGQAVVAGTVYANGQEYIGVIRLTANGYFDNTFGIQGRSLVGFSLNGPTYDSAAAVAVDGKGRIVVAGTTQPQTGPENTAFAVARLTPDGLFDPTFGSHGRSFAGFALNGLVDDTAKALAIDAWDRIVVAGSIADVAGHVDSAVIRLTPTGVWDSSFGSQGRTDAGFNAGGKNYDAANALALDSAGRIVIAGGAETGNGEDFAVARIDNGPMTSDAYKMTITNPALTAVGGALYTDILQAGAPTCWIDATMAELAFQGVDLSQRIHYLGNNVYSVALYDRNVKSNPWTGGYHPVSELVYFDGTRTKADLAFDPAQSGESWPVIMQRAIIEAVEQFDPSESITNPHGGDAADALAVLTGRWTTNTISPTAPDVQQQVINALAAHKNVMFNTLGTTSNLVATHWYAVLRANSQGVTMYNPWGVLVTVSWSVIAQDGNLFEVN